MAEEHKVRILGWPDEPATLQHHFELDKPLPVSVSFQPPSARAVVSTEMGKRMAVDMDMNLRVGDMVPLCIKLCEPICAESSYAIGISIFDHPVISITIRGKTRLSGCGEEF